MSSSVTEQSCLNPSFHGVREEIRQQNQTPESVREAFENLDPRGRDNLGIWQQLYDLTPSIDKSNPPLWLILKQSLERSPYKLTESNHLEYQATFIEDDQGTINGITPKHLKVSTVMWGKDPRRRLFIAIRVVKWLEKYEKQDKPSNVEERKIQLRFVLTISQKYADENWFVVSGTANTVFNTTLFGNETPFGTARPSQTLTHEHMPSIKRLLNNRMIDHNHRSLCFAFQKNTHPQLSTWTCSPVYLKGDYCTQLFHERKGFSRDAKQSTGIEKEDKNRLELEQGESKTSS
ncbi:MAG: hypothetical protein AAGI90_01265 [Chlamydiota bacterium]